MWTTRSEKLTDAEGMRFQIDLNARSASFEDVLRSLQNDATFRKLFNLLLADAPYTAFRWETPSVNFATKRRPFEFVLLNSPRLIRETEPDAYSEHFLKADTDVVVFGNLSGDSTLIAPRPIVSHEAYGHLAAFVRLAPEHQMHALWQTVGNAMVDRIGIKPTWLSTAGAGVSWLHVRLDNRPKYYSYEPYK